MSRVWDESKVIRDDHGRFAGSVMQTAPFSDQENVELKDYKEGGYREVNASLAKAKGGTPAFDPDRGNIVAELDSAIGKSVLEHDTVVYRGIQSPALAAQAESLIGKTLNPPTFLSTSTSSQVARDFAGFGNGSVVLALKAKKGTNAAFLDQFHVAGNANENELLFGRNSKIRLTGVDRTRSPMVIKGEFE